MNSRISSLDPKLRSGLLIFAALLISFALWAAVYLREEPFAALYEDLRGEEAAEISQQLEAWKIPFQVTDQGRRLEISAEAVEPTRLRLLSAGIPSGGRVGFELFKDSDFGVTELAQRVNFQRALQGELERTIAGFAWIERVRVHLNLPESDGLIGRTQRKRASVAIQPRADIQPTADQVRGIQALVAATLNGETSDVFVLDFAGAPLTLQNGGSEAQLQGRLRDQNAVEQRLEARISGLLASVFPHGQYRVAVTAELDLDQVTRDLEQAVPAEPGKGAKGVATPSGRSKESVVTMPGRVENAHIAVLVPRDTPEQMLVEIRSLVSAAVGLRDERGDSIRISPLLAVNVVAEPAAPAVEADAVQLPSAAAAAPPTATSSTTPKRGFSLWLLLTVGALCLVLGVWIARTRQTGKRLSSREREQAMLQIRSWLAEGDAA